jgi:mannobiose 2-epimerase
MHLTRPPTTRSHPWQSNAHGARRVWRSGALGLVACLLLLVSACGERQHIDVEWHRQDLTEGLLKHWLQVAPTRSGAMRSAFDQQWRPLAAQPNNLIDQSRLVYSLIRGYELTGERRFLDAATGGADFLLAHYHDPVHGGFFMRVAPDGTVLSDGKNTYAHSFTLLALSHMARITQQQRYRQAALDTWREIDLHMRDSHGHFRSEFPRDFTPAPDGGYHSQNPLMHLFEALLALHDATADPIALQGAQTVADFVLYHLLQGSSDGSAHIPEWYDVDWKPLKTRQDGAYVDIGHQFEWSHMLLAAEQRGMPAIYRPAAERIIAFALKVGYDEADGGIMARWYPDASVDTNKHYWEQAEGLRAMMAYASASGKPDMWRRYEMTKTFVREQFVDPKNGGWHQQARDQCRGYQCTNDQIEPYHMVGMHAHALTLGARVK